MAPRSLGDGQTDGIIEPEQLAQTVVETIREERLSERRTFEMEIIELKNNLNMKDKVVCQVEVKINSLTQEIKSLKNR